jgi:hypothetical protein
LQSAFLLLSLPSRYDGGQLHPQQRFGLSQFASDSEFQVPEHGQMHTPFPLAGFVSFFILVTITSLLPSFLKTILTPAPLNPTVKDVP